MNFVCPICGCNETDIVLRVVRFGKRWDIYGCGNCRTQFVDYMPTRTELESLYGEFYNNPVHKKDLLNPNYGKLSFPRQWRVIKGLVAKREGKILDYGCGGGQFLDRVSGGWMKYGVDISESARDVAKGKGIKVFESADALLSLGMFGCFDVITMFATIEHLPNPKDIVGCLSNLLRSGGVFVIMTGDVGSIKARLQGERWHLYTPPGHIYFFTAHSVDWLMELLGFKKVKSLYTDGGVTRIPFVPLNLMLRAGLEIYFRLPMLNKVSLFDTYYGYYKKVGV